MLTMNIREPLITTLIKVSKPGVVESEYAQDSRVDIVVDDRVLHWPKTEFIRCSQDPASLHSSACQPHRESIRVMIAAVAALGKRRSTKLAAPDHKRRIEEPSTRRSVSKAEIG